MIDNTMNLYFFIRTDGYFDFFYTPGITGFNFKSELVIYNHFIFFGNFAGHLDNHTGHGIGFTFYAVEFKFNPLIPLLGGVVISAVAAFLGVGGGFLLVPFLTSVAELPMYLAAGTSALAVLISMITSIITLISKGVTFDWALIGLELVGIAVGSVIGPRTSKYFSDLWLKRLFIVLALYVGIDYVLAGFFNIKITG